MNSTLKTPKWLRRLIVFIASSIAIVALAFAALALYLEGADTVATHDLPEGHRLFVERGREMDSSQNVYISVKGPTISHGRVYVTGVGSGEIVSELRLHGDSNSKVYWLTATSAPTSIVYMADFENKTYWPSWSLLKDSAKEEDVGNRLLAIANRTTNIYHLRDKWKSEDWIGVPRPNDIWDTKR